MGGKWLAFDVNVSVCAEEDERAELIRQGVRQACEAVTSRDRQGRAFSSFALVGLDSNHILVLLEAAGDAPQDPLIAGLPLGDVFAQMTKSDRTDKGFTHVRYRPAEDTPWLKFAPVLRDIEISLGTGANTRIEYMYRDGSNNKVGCSEVLAGSPSADDVVRMLSTLSDGVYFIPGQVELRDLQGDFTHGSKWDEDDDHVWHTLEVLSSTDEDPTHEVDFDGVLEFWPESPDGWDIVSQTAALASR